MNFEEVYVEAVKRDHVVLDIYRQMSSGQLAVECFPLATSRYRLARSLVEERNNFYALMARSKDQSPTLFKVSKPYRLIPEYCPLCGSPDCLGKIIPGYGLEGLAVLFGELKAFFEKLRSE